MSAVIYTPSMHIVKRYATSAAAKGALSRAKRTGRMVRETSFGKGRFKAEEIAELKVATAEEFAAMDTLVTVKSLMSGDEVEIRKSEVGGPCDPSTERYWSM